jgi:hypothetical protein
MPLESASALRTAELPALVGRPGLAQGVYGDVGNLELVAPAADRGFWVFWFNADEIEHRQGAAVGEWSGGLHVDTGGALNAAHISQVAAGPGFLEVLAVATGGALQRLHWTPADGFVDDGALARDVRCTSAMVETRDGALHALAVDAGGRLLHLHATAVGYPQVDWRQKVVAALDRRAGGDATAVSLICDGGDGLIGSVLAAGRVHVLRCRRAPGDEPAWRADGEVSAALGWRDAVLVDAPAGPAVVGVDPAGQLCATPIAGTDSPVVLLPAPSAPGQMLTAAATSLDGGRIDAVLSADNALWHAHGRLDGGSPWTPAMPVRSHVWRTPGAPVHRRSSHSPPPPE